MTLPTKAVVLARGLGTRMRVPAAATALAPDQAAAADTGMKGMIPVGGRPFLDYLLAALADAGFTDVCLVIGPEQGAFRDRYVSNPDVRRLRVASAVQHQARGTADAVLCASDFVGTDVFLLLNSDNYYPPALLAEVRRQQPPALPAFNRQALVRDGGIPPERIARYALLDVDPDGSLRRIVEKPDRATLDSLGDAPVSMNCWLLTPGIFDACRDVPLSPRGELELPLAVQYAIDALGMRFTTVRTDAPVLDLSHREDIPVVAARLESIDVRL